MHGRSLTKRSLLAAAGVLAAIGLAAPAAALAGTANAGLATAVGATNPIANMTWGHYKGTLDGVYPAYKHAHGAAKTELAEVALRPEAYWFGGWNPNPEGAAQNYIEHVQNGDKNTLVQMSDFSISPWENKACVTPQTPSLVAANEHWNAQFAAGIGDTRALVVLEPDLPVVKSDCMTTTDRAAVYTEMNYAAQTLNALPYTTVYIDAGSSDWLSVGSATTILLNSGIKYVRGFALNATHFDSTQHEIAYGQKIVKGLAAHGVKNVHFIIDTSENGHPFTHQAYTKAGQSSSIWASRPACVKGRHVPFCQTFGIPPTWETALPQWKLGSKDSALAYKLVDGYVWFGRPWMKGQSSPFDPVLTKGMAKSTPFPYSKFPEPTA